MKRYHAIAERLSTGIASSVSSAESAPRRWSSSRHDAPDGIAKRNRARWLATWRASYLVRLSNLMLGAHPERVVRRPRLSWLTPYRVRGLYLCNRQVWPGRTHVSRLRVEATTEQACFPPRKRPRTPRQNSLKRAHGSGSCPLVHICSRAWTRAYARLAVVRCECMPHIYGEGWLYSSGLFRAEFKVLIRRAVPARRIVSPQASRWHWRRSSWVLLGLIPKTRLW